jgi:hypothetical protein
MVTAAGLIFFGAPERMKHKQLSSALMIVR